MRAVVGTGLSLLHRSLRPFVESELRSRHAEQWKEIADAALVGMPATGAATAAAVPAEASAAEASADASAEDAPQEHAPAASAADYDVAALLQIIERNWSTVFVSRLTPNDRAAVGELRGVRNQFAHERPFTGPEALRALDAIQRLLRGIGDTTAANDVVRLKGGLAAPLPAARPKRSASASGTSRTSRTSSGSSRAASSASALSSFSSSVGTSSSSQSSFVRGTGAVATASAGAGPALAPAAQFAPKPSREETRPPVAGGPASWAAEIEEIAEAFTGQFGRTFRTFGSPALGSMGIHDAVAGVQWYCTRDLTNGQVELAVNLEGMPYDGWPVARLIERELQAPELCALAPTLAHADLITLHWMRDCWQAMSRLKILESDIAPTPLTLDQLTPDAWRQALADAQQCLDSEREHRGRGRQVVTTAASRTQGERDVSPHLFFRTRVSLPGTGRDWDAVLKESAARLESLHTWLTDRASA